MNFVLEARQIFFVRRTVNKMEVERMDFIPRASWEAKRIETESALSHESPDKRESAG
jgi:hypothetical protein